MIMLKFNKLFSIRIISLIIAVCFISTLVYCPPVYALRVSMDKDYERLNEMNSIQKPKPASRRDFLKRSAVFVTGITVLPILLTGDSTKIPDAMEGIDEYILSFDFLYSLAKKEGSAYIQGVYYAVKLDKVDRAQAEKFLRRIFNDEPLLWMREEAVKALIELDMITESELEVLIEDIPDESVLVAIASAFEKKDSSKAVKFLIKWFEKERIESVRAAIITVLGEIGKKEASAEEYLIELGKKSYPDALYLKDDLMLALAEIGTKRARQCIEKLVPEGIQDVKYFQKIALRYIELQDYSIEDLLTILSNTKEEVTSIAIIRILQEKAIKEGKEEMVASRLMVASRFYIDAPNFLIYTNILREFTLTLGKLATKEAVDHLINIKQKMENIGSDAQYYELTCLASAFAQAGDRKSIDCLDKWNREESRPGVWQEVAKARGQVHTGESLNSLISSIKERDEADKSAYQLFSACGFESLKILNKELRIQQLSEDQAKNIKNVIESILEYYIESSAAGSLRTMNYLYDNLPSVGQEIIDLYFKRLKHNPAVIYSILALSQEITSHSFPVAYQYLKEYITGKYKTFDPFRYISEEWRNLFLSEFLFTVTIFGQLEDSFEQAAYSPQELASLILSKEKIDFLLKKPALFSKTIINIMSFKNQNLRKAFLDKIIELGKKDRRFKILVKLLLNHNVVQEEKKLVSLVSDLALPELDPLWDAPKNDLLKDNTLSVGLYWSTSKSGEKAHYEQFPNSFIDGSKVNSFYNNFGGYINKSKDPGYKDKLVKNGAEGVLVKEFPGTGRKIEIYLYSSLNTIKASPHAITISRGHAGDQGNTDYPGLPGTLRFASHCRSINNSDDLIQANPDSPVITITGTGKAVETNPTLYYLLEYLGNEEQWGNWQDIKEYIKPHIPQSIQKYNFPTDDVSFIYAAILQKLEPQEIQEIDSLNIQMGIIGVFKSIRSRI
ncbi:MAG: hypothetical protein KKH08_01605 [Candidatus Omnitrophica bacterium]|nr:hypothetical protein [Candidatus Omnitrophota bacterium]